MFIIYFYLTIAIIIILLYHTIVQLNKSVLHSTSNKDLQYYHVDDYTLKHLFFNTSSTNTSDLHNVLEQCKIIHSSLTPPTPACSKPYSQCVHFDSAFKLFHSAGTSPVIYSPNKNIDDGYCINVFVTNSNNQKKLVKDDTSHNNHNNETNVNTLSKCNPNTSERILTKPLSTSDTFKIDCICKHPDLIDQRWPLESDCDIPVACSGGTLSGADWANATQSVNIVDELYCTNCPDDTFPDRNRETNYPICRHLTFAESKLADDDDADEDDKTPQIFQRHRRLYPHNIPLLSLTDHAIEPQFVKEFTIPDNRKVPNPCSFDIFTTKIFRNNECELTHIPDKSIYFCKSNNISVATVQIDDDYLRGNGGRWANGCFRYTDSDINTEYAVAEFYNVIPQQPKTLTSHPIIGYAINESKLSSHLINMLHVQNIK